MANVDNRKRDKVSVDMRKHVLRGGALALVVIAAVLAVCAAVSGLLFMSLIGYTRSDVEYKTEYIHNDDEFYELMNSRMVSHEYCLLTDIKISAKKWKSTMSNIVLRGVLNGNGHKLTVVGDLNIPLFSRIEKTAQVSCMAFENIVLDGEKAVSAAILTYANYGKISDCMFTKVEANVGTEQYVSLVATHNFGKIENCVIGGKFVAGNVTAGRTAVGAVAAINYKNAEIKNCIVDCEYTSGFDAIKNPFFGEVEVNDKLGYAVGQNNGTLGAIYCVDAEYFDYSSDGKYENAVYNIKNSDLTVRLVTLLGFASDYWEIENGKQPVLKTMVGV